MSTFNPMIRVYATSPEGSAGLDLVCEECETTIELAGTPSLEGVIDAASGHIAQHWIQGFADWLDGFVGGLRAAAAADRAARADQDRERASRPVYDDLIFKQGSGPESFDCPETAPADLELLTARGEPRCTTRDAGRQCRLPVHPSHGLAHVFE